MFRNVHQDIFTLTQ